MAEKSLQSLRDEARRVYKVNADSLSAVPAVFTAEQLRLLYQATPERHIHHMPGNAGAKANLPFVTGSYIKAFLDRLTGFMWNFEIKEKGNTAGQIWVLGRLTILDQNGKPTIFKEQFGRASIKLKKDSKDPVDIGNDMKAAATDALKKCASELGVARDVYGANEFIELDVVDRKDYEESQDEHSAEDTTPPIKVDEKYRTHVTTLLLEVFPKTFERVSFIKDATKKMQLDKLNDYDWIFLEQELTARKLAALQPDTTDGENEELSSPSNP